MTPPLVQDFSQTKLGKGFGLYVDDLDDLAPRGWIVEVALEFYGEKQCKKEAWPLPLQSQGWEKHQVVDYIWRRAADFSDPKGRVLKTCKITHYHWPLLQEDIDHYHQRGVLVIPFRIDY